MAARRASAVRLPAVLAALALAVGGCGGEDEPSGTGAAAPAARAQEQEQASESAARPAPPAPEARAVRFRAADGLALRGQLVPGPGPRSPGVVLVHQSNGGPDQFADFVPSLREQGFAALTYRSRPLPDRMDEAENAQDIAGAVRALRRRSGVDPERIAVVGASIGATSAAYHSFAAGPGVRATVGLSPGTFLDEEPPAGTPQDVLLIADEAERTSAEFLAAASPGMTVRVAPIDGHGVDLLADARVRADVLEWLTARLDG